MLDKSALKFRVTKKCLAAFAFQMGLLMLSVFFAISNEWPLEFLCALTLVSSVSLLVMLSIIEEQFFTISILFMMFLSVFHFGQAWIYLFGAEVDTKISYDIFSLYSYQQIYEIMSFCLVAYNLLGIFLIAFFDKMANYQTPKNLPEMFSEAQRIKLYRFACVFFFVLVMPVAIYDYMSITITMASGHIGLYEQSDALATWAAANSYLPFVIIMLLLGSDKKSDTWKWIYAYAIGRCLLLMILTGKRGSLIIPLLIYVYCKHKFIKPIKKSNAIWVVICGVVLLSLISFIAYTRGDYSNENFFEFILKKNIIVQILSELGGTFTTTVLAFRYTENEMVLNGKSYLGALSVSVPLSDYFFPEIKQYYSLETILNQYSPSGGALGGSLFGELFINFKWASLLIVPIISLAVAKIEKSINRFESSLFTKCASVYFAYGLWIFVRGNLVDIVFIAKRILYVFIIYYLFSLIFNKSSEKLS
ncbi:MAG: O-antigen polysaccharide polymerase Wzy [Acidaminococcaceae bacterium]